MTTQTFTETLDEIIDERSLLKHPFYQAWNAGTLPLESLRDYAKQYFHFEAAFPTFLSAIHARMEPGEARKAVLENLWDEEHGDENHLALWLQFCESLGLDEAEVRASEPNAETRDLVDGFRAACSDGSVGEGLATLYAYESQAPARRRARRSSVCRSFYGFDDPRGYEFFSVHQGRRRVPLRRRSATSLSPPRRRPTRAPDWRRRLGQPPTVFGASSTEPTPASAN